MKRIDQVTRENNIAKKDVTLLIDFRPANGVGVPPALKDTPEFKVEATRDLVEGDRPAEPDWLERGKASYKNKVKKFLFTLQHCSNQTTGNELLTLVHKPGNGSWDSNMSLQLMPVLLKTSAPSIVFVFQDILRVFSSFASSRMVWIPSNCIRTFALTLSHEQCAAMTAV